MDLDTRDLRYFAEIVECGSLGRAAESLSITQPALTRCVRLLEQQLGVKLLERTSKGVTTTLYGQALYVRAKSITAEIVRARTELQELSGTSAGQLSVGVLPSQASELLPEAVVRLTRLKPSLRFRVVELQRKPLMAALRRGEFELIISVVDEEEAAPELSYRVLSYDRPAVVVRRGHPLTRASSVQPADLMRYPWIMPPSSSGRRKQIEEIFSDIGILAPQEVVQCQSMSFQKAMIIRSDYIGILPNDTISVEERAGLIASIRLEQLHPARPIGALYRSEYPLTLAAQALIRELQNTSHRMGKRQTLSGH